MWKCLLASATPDHPPVYKCGRMSREDGRYIGSRPQQSFCPPLLMSAIHRHWPGCPGFSTTKRGHTRLRGLVAGLTTPNSINSSMKRLTSQKNYPKQGGWTCQSCGRKHPKKRKRCCTNLSCALNNAPANTSRLWCVVWDIYS